MRWIWFALPSLILTVFFFLAKSSHGTGKINVLTLAHNLDESHPVHKALVHFANKVETETQGKLQIPVYPNGQLGNEREVIELLQLGAVSMTKVSSLSLESFVPQYSVFNLPFIFRDRDHFFKVLDGPIGDQMHGQGQAKLFRGISYYDSGARSFYAKKAIYHPDDLKGQKIRVMGSQTAIKMMQLLGGSPTPMPYGEIYTALQQRVIDGAENNITALILSRHGEAVSHYSLDEHIMAPDVVILSENIWNRLSDHTQQIILHAARESSFYQRRLWKELNNKFLEKAEKEMGIQIIFPKKAAFIEKVAPLHEELARRGPFYQDTINKIKNQSLNDRK